MLNTKFLPLIVTLMLFSYSIEAQVVADFSTFNGTSGCAPLTVNFKNESSGTSGTVSYLWKFNHPSGLPFSTLKDPSYIFAAPGTYTVSLQVTAANGTATKIKTTYITVYDTPKVDFTGTPTIGCAPLTVNFSHTGVSGGTGANTYTWFFGSAATPATTTTTSPNASAVYTAGPNNVTLVVKNSYQCQSSKTKNLYIDVYPKPNANFSVDVKDFCNTPGSGTSVFTSIASGGTGPYTYTWIWGDTQPNGSGASASHTYTFPANSYSPKLVVVDANGCRDTNTKNNFINAHSPTASISGPSSVCQGSPISFTSSVSPSGGSYLWNFGDLPPGSASTPNPTYVYNTAGTFTVTLSYNYRGCVVTATKTVTVNPKPALNFSISPDTLCPAPAYVQFIANATYSSYWWSFGDPLNTRSTLPTPIFQYQSNGYYSPRFAATTSFGCTDTITKGDFVKIHDLFEEISVGDQKDTTKGCKPYTVFFKDSAFTNIPNNIKRRYPYPIGTWDWDWGDNTTHGNASHPIHTYTDTGKYRVILTIATTKGCVAKDTFWVLVGSKPCVDFTATPRRICNCKEVTFTNLNTCPATSYHWFFGDGSDSYSKNPTHRYCTPDTVNVMLIAEHYGCADTMTKTDYIIIDSPKSIIEAKPSCDTPLKVYFKNRSLGFTSHRWYFGDPANTQSTAMDPVFTYPALGTYTVRLATYSSRTGCSDTAEYQLNLVVPTATVSASDTTICQGDSIIFTGQLVGRSAVTYAWYIDNVLRGTTFYNPTIKLFFPTKGYHTLKLVITDDIGCNTTLIKNNYILVSRPAVADTALPLTGCTPLNVTFIDNTTYPAGVTMATRYWDFGNGVKGFYPTAPTTITYTNPGPYDIKLVITDNIGCKDSLTKVAYVIASKPRAAFAVKDSACINENLTFTNNSYAQGAALTSYSWDFGDGGKSTSQYPTHAYAATGSYTVTLIVTDAFGCKDTLIKTAAVNITKPVAQFSMSDSVAVCPPLYVKFTNLTPNIVSSSWTLGNGNVSNSYNTNSLYTTNGKYLVVLKVTDRFGCTDSITKRVTIYGFSGAFSYGPLDGCSPLTVTFNANVSNVAGMEWDFSDGVVIKQLGPTISHTYIAPGAYLPKLVVSDISGCKAVSPGLDTIKVDGVIPDFIPDAPCQYSTVILRDSSKSFFSPISSWKWTFDDGSKSSATNPAHYYGAPGKYPVKMVVENVRGCKDSIIKDMEVFALPVISAGADSIICLRDSAQLTATGGVSYIWNNSPFLSCLNCPDPKAFPTVKTWFTVTGKDIHNCVNIDTVVVDIKTKVTAASAPDGEICDNDTLHLYVTGAKTYKWSPPDGLDNPNSGYPIASPHTDVKYRVISFEGSCIPDTDYVKVTVHPLPDVTASGDATIIAGGSTGILAQGKLISKFSWSPAESLSCSDCPDPIASPKKTTDYIITVYTNYGCLDSDKVTVKVLCDKSQIFMPNTFTPNGDGQNDIFYPRGVGLSNARSFRIYNRWGEVVFERANIQMNDQTQAWDGTFKGTLLPPDVYVYTLDAECEDGQRMNIKGDVTIVR